MNANRIPTLAKRLLIYITSVYLVFLISIMLLYLTEASDFWLLNLLRVFAPFLFLPLPLVIVGAIVHRSRSSRLMTTIAVVLFLLVFGDRIIPPKQRQSGGKKIVVMTLNYNGYGSEHFDQFATDIQSFNADVICLQEVTELVASQIQQAFTKEYPYQFLAPGMPEFGLGIISKYPLVNTRVEKDFVGQTADLLFDGDVITVVNVHPLVPEMKFAGPYNPNSFRMLTYYDTSNRTRQLNNIMSKAKEIQNKLIVVGDFNTSDNEAVYKQLKMVMKDVYRETSGGFGFTFPNRKLTWPVVFPTPIPLVRIDYIWIKGSLTALEAHVDCKKGASDHCILISTLVKS